MRAPKRQAWLFPTCFFIFFSIYLFVKFLFVFFFSAAYEPRFIYQMTPFYLFSGVSNIQLLSLSLVLCVFDLYLHVFVSKRKLLLSFLPTSLLGLGIGYTVMFNPPDISFIFHYGLFGCLMLVILVDYQYVLKGVEAVAIPRATTSMMNVMTKGPLRNRTKPLFRRHSSLHQQRITPHPAESTTALHNVSQMLLQKMQTIVDDLERKTDRIEQLERKFEEQQRIIANQGMATKSVNLPSASKEQLNQNNLIGGISAEERIILKEKIENHLIVDEMNGLVAIVQRGIFKEISNSFAGFLGYERTELLQKNFFIFIAPRGFDDARKYYLNRLKGVTSNSFRTVLRTKTQTELLVEITVTPTIYKGDSAEFLCIKEVKNVT